MWIWREGEGVELLLGVGSPPRVVGAGGGRRERWGAGGGGARKEDVDTRGEGGGWKAGFNPGAKREDEGRGCVGRKVGRIWEAGGEEGSRELSSS